MEQNILISVIIPVYKVEQYLDRCVQSVFGQTYSNLEIILVDDGSPDNCPTLCDEYASQDSRVKVIHKPNGGLSSARNAGMESAKGEFIAFLDSDDYIEPDTYEAMLSMALQENVKLVCAGRYDIDSETMVRTQGLCPQKREVISSAELVNRMFTWNHIDCAATDKLYHRSILGDIRYPLGVVCEDVPTTYRWAMNAELAGMLDKPVYNYFHRPGSITTDSLKEQSFHFTEHTPHILEDIRKNCPKCLDAALYLRIRSLSNAVQQVALRGKSAKKRFSSQYRKYKKELWAMLPEAFRNPYVSKKEKLFWTLQVLGLYAPVLKVYLFLRYRERI